MSEGEEIYTQNEEKSTSSTAKQSQSSETRTIIVVGTFLLIVNMLFAGYSLMSAMVIKAFHMNVYILIMGRTLVASVGTTSLAFFAEKGLILPKPFTYRELMYFSILGITSYSLNGIMYLETVKLTSVSFAVVLYQLTPIFNTIFSYFLSIEKTGPDNKFKTGFQICGILVGCSCALAVTLIGFQYPQNKVPSMNWVYGALIGTLENLLESAFFLFQVRLFYGNPMSNMRERPFTVHAYGNICGATLYSLCLLPYLILNKEELFNIQPISALPILYTGIGLTTVCYALLSYCNKRSSPVIVGSTYSSYVVLSLVVLRISGYETMYISQYCCVVGVIIGVLLVLMAPLLNSIIYPRWLRKNLIKSETVSVLDLLT